jgi:hypothetical protein
LRRTISLLVPTKFPEGFRALVSSALERAAHPGRVRVFAGVDRGAELPGAGDAVVVPVDGGSLFSAVAFFNCAAALAGAGLVWCLGDDCVVYTDGWDLELDALLPGELGYVDEYGSPFPPNCDHPVLTGDGVAVLGWAMPPCFVNYGADPATLRVYERAGMVRRLPRVRLYHARDLGGARARRMVELSPGWESVPFDVAAPAAKLVAAFSGRYY